MPPETATSGLDALDAKATQRRHRTPPPPKRQPKAPEQATQGPEQPVQPATPPPAPEPPVTVEPPPTALPVPSAAPAPEVVPRPVSGRPGRTTRPVDPAAVAAAVKVAHDQGLAYGSVVRKAAERTDLWAAQLRAARQVGASPGLLRAGLEDAANRAGIDVTAIPAVVWIAAGLQPPA